MNPVETTKTPTSSAPAPSKTLGVDLADKPKPTQEKPDKSDGEEDDGADGKGKFHEFWDWFTGKVNSWWDKVTGKDGSGDTDGGDNDPEPDMDPNE